MRKKALYKDLLVEIKKSFNRFLSILFIVALGVAFYAGLQSTAPNMRYNADAYYDQQSLMDLRIIATKGLTDDDLEAIKAVKGVKQAEAANLADVLVESDNEQIVMRVESLTSKINQLEVVSGKLPQAVGEVAIDSKVAKANQYKLGDTIMLADTETASNALLTEKSYKITAIVNSPAYISYGRGSTNIGNGTISGFMYMTKDNFNLTDLSTQILIQVDGAQNLTAYTKAYDNLIDTVTKRLEKISVTQNQKRYDELKSTAQASVDSAKAQLETLQAQSELIGQSAGQTMIIDGQTVNQAALENLISENTLKINEAQVQIDQLQTPTWQIQTRDDLPDYSGLGDNAERIRNIGNVFPLIFFLVAALISLTTMTRMVEEERMNIGTLKALGYGKWDIAFKYLTYAFLATIIGGVIGVLIGEKIFPRIIISAYGIMYSNMPIGTMPYNLKFALISVGAAFVATIGATIFSCYQALFQTPAALMRPPVPKAGKRVLLERIGLIWNHLSFTWKATIRNLFRYKKRFLMTIFGIGSCLSLILIGFGLRDSILDIGTLQYNKLQTYDALLMGNSEADSTSVEKLQTTLSDEKAIKSYLPIQMKTQRVSFGDEHLDSYVLVPKTLSGLDDYLTFRDRKTGKVYQLNDEGVIISEKMARLLDVKKGDTIKLSDEGRNQVSVKVAEVTENYVMYYTYLSPKLYQELYGESPQFNDYLLILKNGSQATDALSERLLEEPATLTIQYTESLKTTMNDMLKALDSVIWVLILSAGLLAFVVLYNLNNININERRRELATIKVLGFYDLELAEYVYRENILLTIIGSLFGVVMGTFLHRYLIVTVEVDDIMFGRNIAMSSYIYSVLITIAFSIFVNFVMFFKLRKINMVESLKSVE